MSDFVSVFQLGSSTVITLPKKLGFKPGQKLELKKSKNGALLELAEKRTLLEIMENVSKDSFWTDQDFKDYEKRRTLGIKVIKKMKKIW